MIIKSIPRDYEVSFVTKTEAVLRALVPGDVLVIDRNVRTLYGLDHSQSVYIDAVEGGKNLNAVMRLIASLDEIGFTKKNKLVVVGGGITQDIAAFAAAIYKRGIPWTYFPTTPLSMVDSCIGGKCAINNYFRKNQLALFSAPRSVVICEEFLRTLSKRDIRSGMGEALKLYTLPGETALFKDHGISDRIVHALNFKKYYIEADEFETKGIRRKLNFGHTVGHALESLSNFAIPHGQAVAVGMIVEQALAKVTHPGLAELGQEIVDAESVQALRSLDYGGLEGLLAADRKTDGDTINFALPRVELSMPNGPELVSRIREIVDEHF